MATPATHADALRIEYASAEVKHLTVLGTIPGVVPLAVAARCGPGLAHLRSTTAGRISFRAPSSSTWGPDVLCEADGTYLLEDGEDPDKWLRVLVYTSYLLAAREAPVLLHDRYNTGVASDDVSAAEAAAGDVETYQLALANDGTAFLSQVTAWIDAATTGIEISDDGITWVSPTTEAAGLAFDPIAPGGSATLHVRRTIAASSPSDAAVLTHLHLAFSGL